MKNLPSEVKTIADWLTGRSKDPPFPWVVGESPRCSLVYLVELGVGAKSNITKIATYDGETIAPFEDIQEVAWYSPRVKFAQFEHYLFVGVQVSPDVYFSNSKQFQITRAAQIVQAEEHSEPNHSGLLQVTSEHLNYSHGGEPVWNIPLDSIRLIGEYTTDHGPYLDDYFLIFASGSPPNYYEAPMYANSEIYQELQAALHDPMKAHLLARTDFSSAVIWPPSLAGRDLFRYTSTKRGTGLLSRVKDWALPLITSHLTDEVCTFLGVAPDRP
ncbi:hypothetical protein JYT83_01395 [bacterium AH-315-F18]|nr:hypothetical protein [bacterium AH-315-F18]